MICPKYLLMVYLAILWRPNGQELQQRKISF
jgi:hypothetical protein